MRLIKWIFGLLLVLIVAFVAIGFLLPREVAVSRTIEINAPAEEIFPWVSNPRASEAWSPWLSIDPDVKVTYGDIESGEGATMTWQSDDQQVGSGSLEHIESVENEKIVTALDFGEMGGATATMVLKELGANTEVTWGFTTDMGAGPVGRWMGLMMDRWVGGDYQRGLNNLKKLVENQ